MLSWVCASVPQQVVVRQRKTGTAMTAGATNALPRCCDEQRHPGSGRAAQGDTRSGSSISACNRACISHDSFIACFHGLQRNSPAAAELLHL